MAHIGERAGWDWHLAATSRGLNPDLFFPATESEEAGAKAICADCPVRVPCLEFAMRARGRYGIWGGTCEHDRKAMRTMQHHREVIGASGR